MPTSEIIVFMDGDGSDVIAFLPQLIAPIARGQQDFVLGNRLGTIRREPHSMLFSQVFASRLVGTLLRIFFPRGFRYHDMPSLRAIRRTSLDSLGMRERTYGWNLEMQIRAIQKGLRVLEIPVLYRARRGGVSKVSGDLRASMEAAVRILEVLFRVALQQRP